MRVANDERLIMSSTACRRNISFSEGFVFVKGVRKVLVSCRAELSGRTVTSQEFREIDRTSFSQRVAAYSLDFVLDS